MEEMVPSHPATASPETPADYEHALEEIFAEIREINERMDRGRQERARLFAESRELKEESEVLRTETRAILARLQARA